MENELINTKLKKRQKIEKNKKYIDSITICNMLSCIHLKHHRNRMADRGIQQKPLKVGETKPIFSPRVLHLLTVVLFPPSYYHCSYEIFSIMGDNSCLTAHIRGGVRAGRSIYRAAVF